MPNAAPQWQAGSMGQRSRVLVGACPLKGLVRLKFHYENQGCPREGLDLNGLS